MARRPPRDQIEAQESLSKPELQSASIALVDSSSSRSVARALASGLDIASALEAPLHLDLDTGLQLPVTNELLAELIEAKALLNDLNKDLNDRIRSDGSDLNFDSDLMLASEILSFRADGGLDTSRLAGSVDDGLAKLLEGEMRSRGLETAGSSSATLLLLQLIRYWRLIVVSWSVSVDSAQLDDKPKNADRSEAVDFQLVPLKDRWFHRDGTLHRHFVDSLEQLLAAYSDAEHRGAWPDDSADLVEARRRQDFLLDYMRRPSEKPASQAEAERIAFALAGQILLLDPNPVSEQLLEVVAGLTELDGTAADDDLAKGAILRTREVVNDVLDAANQDKVDGTAVLGELREIAADEGITPGDVALGVRRRAGELADSAANRFGPPLPVGLGMGSVVGGGVGLVVGGPPGAALGSLIGGGAGSVFGLLWGWLRTFPATTQ